MRDNEAGSMTRKEKILTSSIVRENPAIKRRAPPVFVFSRAWQINRLEERKWNFHSQPPLDPNLIARGHNLAAPLMRNYMNSWFQPRSAINLRLRLRLRLPPAQKVDEIDSMQQPRQGHQKQAFSWRKEWKEKKMKKKKEKCLEWNRVCSTSLWRVV